jgi:hypothetical protein
MTTQLNKYILFLFFLFIINQTVGQTPNPIVNTFGIHKSFHGTGDLKGFDVNVTKTNKINNSFDWFYSTSLTLHFGQDNAGSYFGMALNVKEPMKFNTFGFQGESGITLKLFEKKFPLNISTGPIVRYQSTSRPRVYTYTADPRYPDALYTIQEIDPNTLSIGYKIQLAIGVMKIRRSRMFFNTNFQNDTHGDVITGLGFVFKNLTY